MLTNTFERDFSWLKSRLFANCVHLNTCCPAFFEFIWRIIEPLFSALERFHHQNTRTDTQFLMSFNKSAAILQTFHVCVALVGCVCVCKSLFFYYCSSASNSKASDSLQTLLDMSPSKPAAATELLEFTSKSISKPLSLIAFVSNETGTALS